MALKITLNATDYLAASREHANTARLLYEEGQYVLSSYTAGLSVESFLRGYSLRYDNNIDRQHNLSKWLIKSRFEAVIPNSEREKFSIDFGVIVEQWDNLHRSCSLDAFRRDLKARRLDRDIKGDFVKERCRKIVNAALDIVTLGAQRWN